MDLINKLRVAYKLGKEANVLYENSFWFHPHLVSEHAQYAGQKDLWEARLKEIETAVKGLGLLEKFVYEIAHDLNMVPLKSLPLKEPIPLRLA